MLHFFVSVFRRRRGAVAALAILALAAAGMSAAPNASAAVGGVPVGVSARILPASCGTITNLVLTNSSSATQRFWLRQPLTAHSWAWVDLPAHTATAVQKTNPKGTGSLNWGVLLNGGPTLASVNLPQDTGTCYTGNYLPDPDSTNAMAAQIYAHCGSQAVITVRNATAVTQIYSVYRNGVAAPITTVHLASTTASFSVPVVGTSSTFSVKNGTTVLAQATMTNLPACTAYRINWGNTLASEDQFNGTSVDTTKWWIYDSPTVYPQRLPSQVSESGGELKLTGHVDPTYGTEESGGVGYQFGQMYGHWEVRFKYDAGAGYRSAILLWPDNEAWPQNGEIDMSEIFKPDRSVETEFQHNGAQNNFIGSLYSADMTQWHTVGVDWLPDRVQYYMDGQEVWTVKAPTAPGAFNYVPTTGTMHLALQNDTSCTTVCTNPATPANVTLHIDWMKAWSLPKR